MSKRSFTILFCFLFSGFFALSSCDDIIEYSPKVGASLNWGYTNNTFRRLPEHYPK